MQLKSIPANQKFTLENCKCCFLKIQNRKLRDHICRESKNKNTLYFYSKHSGVMTWQAHVLGHAPSPPPTGRDESEDTQVELVLLEHSFEQVELKAVLSFDCTCYFQHILASLKIKEHH